MAWVPTTTIGSAGKAAALSLARGMTWALAGLLRTSRSPSRRRAARRRSPTRPRSARRRLTPIHPTTAQPRPRRSTPEASRGGSRCFQLVSHLLIHEVFQRPAGDEPPQVLLEEVRRAREMLGVGAG